MRRFPALTLLLLAAAIPAATMNGQQPEKLTAIVDMLLTEEAGLQLAGGVFADGCGTEESFGRWFDLYVPWLISRPSAEADAVARSWSGSRQENRKALMANAFCERAEAFGWSEWMRAREWIGATGMRMTIPLPKEASNARALIEAQYRRIDSPQKIAVGRILASGVPFWPGDPWELVLLATWPCRRRHAGHVMQALALLGLGRHRLLEIAESVPDLFTPLPDAVSLKGEQLDDLCDTLFATVLWQERQLAAKSFAIDWLTQIPPLRLEAGISEWVPDWREYSGNFDRYWAREAANRYVRALHSAGNPLGPAGISRSPLENAGGTVAASLGLLGYLAHFELRPAPEPVRLICLAARLALDPESDPRPLKRALSLYSERIDPLWLALARHLAYRGTPGDISVMKEAVENPDSRSDRFQWALRYIVRGDVYLDDGSELLLDEVTSHLGLDALPYVEQYPELEVLPYGEK